MDSGRQAAEAEAQAHMVGGVINIMMHVARVAVRYVTEWLIHYKFEQATYEPGWSGNHTDNLSSPSSLARRSYFAKLSSL
jgi:hypothetical protein